jgi:CDP-diacylglycerol--glycerol-3-phosphate 3-phosphatidyltransferase
VTRSVKLVPAGVERGYYAVTGPLVRGLVNAGVRPNTITTIGTLLVVTSGVFYGVGWIRTGGLLLLLSGALDTLDGAVARHSGASTTFGAFYDSTLDRIGDGATFIGIAAYLLHAPDVAYRNLAIILAMIATLASLVVSYARARAEGLGIDCRVGIAQRAERIIGLGLASLLVGAGPRALVLEAIVGLLAVASIVTVIQRFYCVYRATQGA